MSGSGSISQRISRISNKTQASLTGSVKFIKNQRWTWPLVIALVLGISGFFIRQRIEGILKKGLETELTTLLNADVEGLEIWLNSQKETVQAWAKIPQIRKSVTALVELEKSIEDSDFRNKLLDAPEQSELDSVLSPLLTARKFCGYTIISKPLQDEPESISRFLASRNLYLDESEEENEKKPDLVAKDLVGMALFDEGLEYSAKVFAGETIVTRPLMPKFGAPDEYGRPQNPVPLMFAVAPIRNDKNRVIASLAIRILPEQNFTKILAVARKGVSGETYAFDKNGTMISQSRFDENLKKIRLLPDDDTTQSLLNIQIRNPGVDMTQGYNPVSRVRDLPLTKMAQSAIDGNSSFDVDGYNDYRGVPVIGAWTWLPDYEFGVASEVDVAEAFEVLYVLRWISACLFFLLCMGSVGIWFYTKKMDRLRLEVQQSVIASKKLGQYALLDKIGEGGMGTVYRGQHAMLQRPTAIKLLHTDKTTDQSLARFEREVRMTSMLTHPNTIAIYDYGRTPEDVFYYAMEFLEGTDLEKFISDYGPIPEERALYFLKQICGSLDEAHQAGIIHRDMKPQNVMITQRGGLFDFVKVLDFGLVKVIDSEKEKGLTNANAMTGTPLYLSPEGIERPDQVDARSDVYAVGAIAYYLVTGKPIFEGANVVEICMHQVNSKPVPPSERSGRILNPQFEELILECLAKNPNDRPEDAKALGNALEEIITEAVWSKHDSEKWWKKPSKYETVDGIAKTRIESTPNLDQMNTIIGDVDSIKDK